MTETHSSRLHDDHEALLDDPRTCPRRLYVVVSIACNIVQGFQDEALIKTLTAVERDRGSRPEPRLRIGRLLAPKGRECAVSYEGLRLCKLTAYRQSMYAHEVQSRCLERVSKMLFELAIWPKMMFNDLRNGARWRSCSPQAELAAPSPPYSTKNKKSC